MKKTLIALLLAVLALPTLLYGTPTASADDTICRGTIGAVTVDNLKVPDNATCTLQGTRVEGNIIVNTGATLRAQGVRVDGNVQAEGARAVNVTADSFVGGSVQIKQGGAATIRRVTINGNLQLESNRGYLDIANNRVQANLQAVQNRGGLNISNNRIAQALQCKQNNPAPTGGGNTAGDKEGQCRGL
jgi:hypothetical protein